MERILRLLQDLGLSKSEAEVYVCLAKKGPQTINALMESLKKSKNEIYVALKGLEKKQVTTRKNKRAILFSAISFEKFLTDYAKIRFDKAKRIEEKRVTLIADWLDMIEEDFIN